MRGGQTRRSGTSAAGTLLLLLAALAGACSTRQQSQPESSVADKPATPAVTATPAAPQASDPIRIRVVDGKEFARALEQYRGKPVLVDFWATWCTSCVARFPQTVALQRRLGSRGLATVSVSFDEPEDEAKVLKFLRSQGAEFENFISRHGGSDESVKDFRLDNGTLPCVQLFGRDGRLYKSFSGETFSETDIEQAVNVLLHPS